MHPHLSVLPLVLLGLSACDGCRAAPGAEDSVPSSRWDPAHTVVLITIDSLNSHMLLESEWGGSVAPTLEGLFDESVRLDNVLTTQGTTRPALGSLITGLYPEEHGARTNYTDLRNGTTILKQFHDAGYTTFGLSSNQCPLLVEDEMDLRFCSWNNELKDESLTLVQRDERLIEDLTAALHQLPADEDLFVWLHLNNVHTPYSANVEDVDILHPEAYLGDLDPSSDDAVTRVTLGLRDYSEADRHYLEAVYAAQIRVTDAHIAEVFDALELIERWDDAVVVVGADHGEELAERGDIKYFWHGCSPYSTVLRVVYSIRAPGRLEGGQVLDAWVSITDIAPTIVELASASAWSGELSGVSLVDYMLGDAAPERSIFASRARATAVMVKDDQKYIYNSTPNFDGCLPYSSYDGFYYPGKFEELYDLSLDPDEVYNLLEDDPVAAVEPRTELCEWFTAVGWHVEGAIESEALHEMCQNWLCSIDSEYCQL